MSSLTNSLESKFNELKVAINQERGKWPSAQGVNALIIVYPPEKEQDYFERVYEEFSGEYIINLSKIFIDYIDKYGIEDFKFMYKNYRSTSIFVDESTEEKDFLQLILDEIEKAAKLNKMPVIIRTGILFGTGIRNNEILESGVVSKLKKPLLIFYPGEIEKNINNKDEIYFLGVVKASDYRGQII